MGMLPDPKKFLKKNRDHLPGFRFRISLRDGPSSLLYQLRQKHHEFSMTEVRKSVIESPAALTI